MNNSSGVFRWAVVWLLLSILTACGGGGGGSGGAGNPDPVVPVPARTSFQVIDDRQWDETAVRKVLHAFAYGGQATDRQIGVWAGMPPEQAIRQMLTFDEHNLLLSPADPDDASALDTRPGTLRALSDFWQSGDPDNRVVDDAGHRELHQYPLMVWYKAAIARGLNPFRQKIGLWETNYHMSTSGRAGVNALQTIRYYDDIMATLESGAPYQDVITEGALSAAVARQFQHFENRFINGRCECNEDFAREYFQRFFGIRGLADPQYHETVTIKNNAKALTDVRLGFDAALGDFNAQIDFGSLYHPSGPLEILHVSIGGSNAAERISELSRFAIEHQESLDNLPVTIVAELADDNLTDAGKDLIRQAWRSMQPKNLLEFLRGYAISPLFHSADRYKFMTSANRQFSIAAQVVHTNTELYSELYVPYDLENEDVFLFAPRHNVFGAQTGLEAADSASVFLNNWNRVTRDYWRYQLPELSQFGIAWEKDWGALVPAGAGGSYGVRAVAEWLWQRFIADGLKNFGLLERAHVYALLATDTDLVFQVNRAELEAAGENVADLGLYDFDRVVWQDELESDPLLIDLVAGMSASTLALSSSDRAARLAANARVGQAINFIVATPYIFVQEGR